MKAEQASAFRLPSASQLHKQAVGKANLGDVGMRAESATGQNPVRGGPHITAAIDREELRHKLPELSKKIGRDKTAQSLGKI